MSLLSTLALVAALAAPPEGGAWKSVGSAPGWSQADRARVVALLDRDLDQRVPRTDLDEVVRSAIAAGASPVQVESLLTSLGSASAHGLPVGLVSGKAREGFAKGVPPARVAEVVQALEGRLEAAHRLLTETGLPPGRLGSRAVLLDLLAEAMERGIPTQGLERALRAGRPASGESLGAALTLLNRMASRGVPSEDATALAGEVLQEGLSHAEIDRVSEALNRAIDLGRGKPGEVVARGREALRQGTPPSAMTDALVSGKTEGPRRPSGISGTERGVSPSEQGRMGTETPYRAGPSPVERGPEEKGPSPGESSPKEEPQQPKIVVPPDTAPRR